MNINNRLVKNKKIILPREIEIGAGCINNIGNICKRLQLAKNALVISGDGKTCGIGMEIVQILESADFNVKLATVKKAEMDEVIRIEKLVSEIGGNTFLAGVGGGKAIDIAKLASNNMGRAFISVPTAASHDGIASSRASIIYNGKMASIEAIPPIAVIADTTIIASAPYKLLASGCGDIISKFTAVLDWKLAHIKKMEEFSDYASQLSEIAASNIMASVELIRRGDEKSAEIVINALIASSISMNIAGSSRPASGSEHKFSHALDKIALKPALHGEQCGVGSIIMMYLHGDDWKKIRQTLKTIGAPVNAEELGIDPGCVVEALLKAHTIRPERYTILESSRLTKKTAEKAVKITGVI